MRYAPLFIVMMVLPVFVLGCEKPRDTPSNVMQAYRTLVGSLDTNHPGTSILRLREFARVNSQYAIAETIDRDLKEWRERLYPAYLKARDLAREEQFDQAEAILKDLAQVPDERAGRMARKFLSFEFHKLKASLLLQKGDTVAAETAARKLRSMPLTERQQAETEGLLDLTKTMEKGIQMTRTNAMKSAARTLHVALYSSYADNGTFPETLSLDSPVLASIRNSGLFSVVGSIENYTATQDEFSLILVGKDPRQRVRVTQSGIEEIR